MMMTMMSIILSYIPNVNFVILLLTEKDFLKNKDLIHKETIWGTRGYLHPCHPQGGKHL